MRKVLACALLLVGIVGLVLGRLGETTWAPDDAHVASVSLDNSGPAVVIDPGVLYVGGREGTLTVQSEGEVSIIAATPTDVAAFLDGTRYTAVTGVPTWTTLSTEERNADGAAEVEGPQSSDLWQAVTTAQSPATLDIAEWAGAELDPAAPQPYRAVLIVADGTAPAASSVSITWPSHDRNDWVPYAYAVGAVFAIVGLVLLLLSITVGRGGSDDEDDTEGTPDGDGPETSESTEVETDAPSADSVGADSVSDDSAGAVSTSDAEPVDASETGELTERLEPANGGAEPVTGGTEPATSGAE
ncbi:MAG: hypothetical protein Q4G21_06830, partial [Dermabacter sp.]|nr:hypothetical protein [Dermabacter sp.]